MGAARTGGIRTVTKVDEVTGIARSTAPSEGNVRKAGTYTINAVVRVAHVDGRTAVGSERVVHFQ